MILIDSKVSICYKHERRSFFLHKVHTQMMAALVLVNNIVNAICVGMTSGVTISICLARYRMSPFTTRTAGGGERWKEWVL